MASPLLVLGLHASKRCQRVGRRGSQTFERGISEVKLPERYAGQSFLATLSLLVRRKIALPGESSAVQNEISALAARWRQPLLHAQRAVTNLLQELRAVGYAGETGHTFVISGWLPQARYRCAARAHAARSWCVGL